MVNILGVTPEQPQIKKLPLLEELTKLQEQMLDENLSPEEKIKPFLALTDGASMLRYLARGFSYRTKEEQIEALNTYNGPVLIIPMSVAGSPIMQQALVEMGRRELFRRELLSKEANLEKTNYEKYFSQLHKIFESHGYAYPTLSEENRTLDRLYDHITALKMLGLDTLEELMIVEKIKGEKE